MIEYIYVYHVYHKLWFIMIESSSACRSSEKPMNKWSIIFYSFFIFGIQIIESFQNANTGRTEWTATQFDTHDLNERPVEFFWRTAMDFGGERSKIYRWTAADL